MTEPLYSGEAICKRWGDSSSGGRTVTLQLEDGGDHPFRGYEGERFAIVVVAIGNDEKPMNKSAGNHEAPRGHVGSEVGETSVTEASDRTKDGASPSPRSKKRWHEMPPSQRAALLVNDPEFERFAELHANYNSGSLGGEATPDRWLKYMCAVDSKSAITPATGAHALFVELEGDFMAWRQARQHGVTP
jgi:hypothetical protein